jgi:serine/threonine protein kinase
VTARDGRHHAFLTDFGLAKRVAADSASTAADVVLGTIDYIAPEQIESAASVDDRADLYALGCVLFHALTGEVPFPRPSAPQKLWAHLHEEPPSALEADDAIPSAFQAVLRRAMEKDADRRFQTAEPELELEEIGAGPGWRTYKPRTMFDDRGLLTDATRRLVRRYGHFTLQLLESSDALPALLDQEHAENEPDQHGTYWARQDDIPRMQGSWVALRPHGNLICSAHLDDRTVDDVSWGEVNDLAQGLASS